jgi:hypothetical protein
MPKCLEKIRNGPDFFLRSQIFPPVWPESSAKSWQHMWVILCAHLRERKAVQVLKQLLESQEKLEARLEQMTLANRQLGQTEPKRARLK